MPKFIDKKFRDKIKFLISKNTPIRVISRQSNLPISTVHYNVRKLSKTYRKLYKPKIDMTDEQKVGEVCGIVAGDGNIFDKEYRIRIFLSYNEIKYAKFIQRLFLEVLGKKFNIFSDISESKIVVDSRSLEIYKFISEILKWKRPKVYSVHLKSKLHRKKFFIGFLRGIFDTDGNIDDWNGYKRLTITSVSKKLIDDIEYALHLLGISFYIRQYKIPRKYKILKVRIDKENAVKFIKVIGTHNPRYSFLGGSSSLV